MTDQAQTRIRNHRRCRKEVSESWSFTAWPVGPSPSLAWPVPRPSTTNPQANESSLFYPLLMIHRLGFVVEKAWPDLKARGEDRYPPLGVSGAIGIV